MARGNRVPWTRPLGQKRRKLAAAGLWVAVQFPEYNMPGYFVAWGREECGYKTTEARPTIREAMLDALAVMDKTHERADKKRARQ